MKLYTIIAGVNGAGKSSLTGALKAERTDLGIIVDVDKIAAAGGLSPIAAGRVAIERMNACIGRGLNFTQETTLAGRRTEASIRRAQVAGYRVRLYYVGLNTARESVQRIANRVARGGHNIPEEDVVRRFEGRFDGLLRVLPYCDEALFLDNENGFVEVAEYRNGELVPKGAYRPEWLRTLLERINAGEKERED